MVMSNTVMSESTERHELNIDDKIRTSGINVMKIGYSWEGKKIGYKWDENQMQLRDRVQMGDRV